jgi:DNA processing protein
MDDRYAALALGYQRGISHQYVVQALQAGLRLPDLLAPGHLERLACGASGAVGPPDRQLAKLKPRIENALSILDSLGAQTIYLGDNDYPPVLAAIPQPPACLYVMGEVATLPLPQIAIVGSRDPSRSGLRDAYELAASLVSGGFTITSGLAQGIDGAAHRGALDGGGKTIAVMGTGLDQVYPKSHGKLMRNILASGGAVVTEFPPGMPPRRENFPRRNRIVSGLSCAVVIVEAQARSGSLITAKCAMEQSRSVCVVPGGIHDPLKEGCHHLIREGAILVRNALDIAEAAEDLIGIHRGLIDSSAANPRRSSTHPLIDLMGADPLSSDQLLEQSGLGAAELARELGELEISGLLYRSPEGFRRAG